MTVDESLLARLIDCVHRCLPRHLDGNQRSASIRMRRIAWVS